MVDSGRLVDAAIAPAVLKRVAQLQVYFGKNVIKLYHSITIGEKLKAERFELLIKEDVKWGLYGQK